MNKQNQPKNWRRMLADLGGYENGLINIPAAGVIPIIDEVEELRARLDELEKQEHAAFVNEQGFIIERDDMQISSGEKLYLAAGARPVEPVQKLRPDFIAGYDAGMADAKRIQAAGARPVEVVPALPNGWVPCIISFDGDPEEVAYGPQVMMDRLSKWLGKHFERVRAEKAAPAAVAGPSEFPHEQMDVMALARYKVMPSHESMLHRYVVVAGDGSQQLYIGREVECENMARKFAGAFLDGAFAFHSMLAAAPTTQPAPGAGDQVQMILKHRLIRKVEGDWLAASEFMTGEPDPSWLAKTEEFPEEWRIEQGRRVSGEQIQAGLTRAFASWKKPAPAAVAELPFAIMDNELKALRRFDECVRDPDAGGHDVRKEMMKRLAEIGLVRRVTANIYEHTNFGLSVLNGDFDAAPTTQPAPAAQADTKDAARWRYAVEIGGNQRMNWLDVYNDWDGEGSFVDAIDAALEASKKEPT